MRRWRRWLGTYDNGICRMDGMATVTTFGWASNNTVWSGLLDRNGELWFGTSAGLVHLVNGTVAPLPPMLKHKNSRCFP